VTTAKPYLKPFYLHFNTPCLLPLGHGHNSKVIFLGYCPRLPIQT
jgi:hypothetical protein